MSSEFGLRGPKTPCVCPSDRQLALRAKLKTGWSVKTNQFNTYPKPPPLSDREQQAIVSVIQKAEELELNEQHRVGKLVDRLESLKRLANGNGVTQCVLCGDSFGLSVFGRNSFRCTDCKKAVCRKCVVDLSTTPTATTSGGGPAPKEPILRLCKLCSENREFIKKSGAWFYKGVPKYVLPEKKSQYTNSFENLTPSSSSYQEQRYMSRYVCGSLGTNLSSGSTNKRSGGIFWSKSLSRRSQSEPEYESSSGDEGVGSSVTAVTTTPATTTASSSSTLGSSSTSRTTPTTDKGSQHHHKSILKRLTSDSTTTSKSSRSSDEMSMPYPPNPTTMAVMLSSEDRLFEISDPSSAEGSSGIRQKSFERFDPADPTQPFNDNNTNTRSSGSSSDGGFHPLVGAAGATPSTPFYNPSAPSRPPPFPSSTGAPVSAGRSHHPPQIPPRPNPRKARAPNAPIPVLQQQQQQQHQAPQQPADDGLGVVEASLLYDDSHQALHCSIHSAKELTSTDINGLSDPYCMLKLIPTRFEGTHLRTKTVHKTLQPVFNETLTFYGVTQNDMARQALQIHVMDEDRWGRDCLGSVQIPLHRVRPQQTRCFTLSLEKTQTLTEEKEWGRGRLLLSLSYVTEKSLLLVGVIRAEGLPALDHNGTSDPFVKVKLLHDAHMGSLSSSSFSVNRKFKTSTKWKTLNPEFREEFSLKVSMVDLPKLALAVAVFDRDLGNNYLGGILLSTTSKGERLNQWTDMMKLPNTKHMKWHTLSPSLLPQ